MPEGVLDFFDVTKVLESTVGLYIYLEEKNIAPEQYKDQKLESKGFLPEIQIQDFPIRNHKVMLCIKRCCWEVKPHNEIISRDWKLVQSGTLPLWYNQVEDSDLESFRTVSRSIQTHYADILNFFVNRSTNASAESFNRTTDRAKIKAFRGINPFSWGERFHEIMHITWIV